MNRLNKELRALEREILAAKPPVVGSPQPAPASKPKRVRPKPADKLSDETTATAERLIEESIEKRHGQFRRAKGKERQKLLDSPEFAGQRADEQAVLAYAGHTDYAFINRSLREGGEVEAAMRARPSVGATTGENIDRLDDFISRSPLTEDVVLYRGVRGDFVDRLVPGTEISDPAFQSWTGAKYRAREAADRPAEGLSRIEQIEREAGKKAKGAVLRLNARAGQAALPIDLTEFEFLIGRNTKIVVTAVEEEMHKGAIQKVVTVEIVGKE